MRSPWLPSDKRATILTLLCEGSGLRAISRITGVSLDTATKLLIDAGRACQGFHDETVQNVRAKRVQCDEIGSFTYAKQANVAMAEAAPEKAGDTWTWTALDADTKLIVSWLVGGRDAEFTAGFVEDVASRLANPVQLTTDGHKPYLEVVAGTFGAEVGYAQLVRIYGSAPGPAGRYSPADCKGIIETRVEGLTELYVQGTLIPKNLLALIGRITTTFSIMDTEMNKVISALLGETPRAVIATQNKMFGARFDILKRLRKVAVLDAKTRTSFDNVLALIGRLNTDCVVLTHNDIVGSATSTDESLGSIALTPKDYWLELEILMGKPARTFTIKQLSILSDEITEPARALAALHLQLVSRKTRVRSASLRKWLEQGHKNRASHNRTS